MPYFNSPEGPLESIFMTDYDLVDRYARTGTLWMWGANGSGQLGTNNTTGYSSPVQTVSLGTNWVQLACGRTTTGAIKADGTLWLWGDNTSGKLGDNTITSKSSPVQTVSGGTNWRKVFLQSFTQRVAAIKTDGTLWIWGSAGAAMGVGNITPSYSSPVQTAAGGTNWKTIALLPGDCLAIKTDGTAWSWGGSSNGQGGFNDRTSRSTPVQLGSETTWKQVAASTGGSSGGTFVAVKTDGTLWAWGQNTQGAVGNGTTAAQSSPVQTSAGGTNWVSCGSGNQTSFGIKTDGTLWAWGQGATVLMVPDGTSTNRTTPTQESTLSTNWKYVTNCGAAYAASAIKTDGSLWMWGRNSGGQIGDNTVASRNVPTQTINGGTNWKQSSNGYDYSGAIFFYDSSELYASK